jgi:hypothetical protein
VRSPRTLVGNRTESDYPRHSSLLVPCPTPQGRSGNQQHKETNTESLTLDPHKGSRQPNFGLYRGRTVAVLYTPNRAEALLDGQVCEVGEGTQCISSDQRRAHRGGAVHWTLIVQPIQREPHHNRQPNTGQCDMGGPIPLVPAYIPH